MDCLVDGRDDDRTVEADDAPCLALTDGDRVGGVGGDLIVLRRDDKAARGSDCAPLLAHADSGERLGRLLCRGGGRCLLCHLCRRCGRRLCRKSCGHRAEDPGGSHGCDYGTQLLVRCHLVISFENILISLSSSRDGHAADAAVRWQ